MARRSSSRKDFVQAKQQKLSWLANNFIEHSILEKAKSIDTCSTSHSVNQRRLKNTANAFWFVLPWHPHFVAKMYRAINAHKFEWAGAYFETPDIRVAWKIRFPNTVESLRMQALRWLVLLGVWLVDSACFCF